MLTNMLNTNFSNKKNIEYLSIKILQLENKLRELEDKIFLLENKQRKYNSLSSTPETEQKNKSISPNTDRIYDFNIHMKNIESYDTLEFT